MTVIRIGIIGVGPRGLTILERLIANERAAKSADLEIHLFDPHEPGVGCHDPDQAEFLLVNTVAGQITQFSDTSVVGAGPVMEGPSFYQWLRDERIDKRRFGQNVTSVSADAYYSRKLFGRYLHWVYHYLCGLAPDHVKINFVKSEVMSAERVAEDSWLLESDHATTRVNYLFLTTGHSKPRGIPSGERAGLGRLAPPGGIETTVVTDPYPVQKNLSFIQPGMTVAIEGMGLTTFDVLAELTVGRGGSFVDSAEGKKKYVPSGREPRIIAISRSGLPLSARAVNQKGVSIQYRPKFLLAEKVREMRSVRKLDFVDDVLPLLLADMEYAYCEAYLREQRDPVSAMLFCNQFVCAADAAERQDLIAQYLPPEDRFSWENLISPCPKEALVSRDVFKAWLLAYLDRDQVEAKKGNVDSPLKAASDVLRDLRDNLRAAIDFGGLTEASHRWLLSEFLPVMNRVAVGPPESRITEMLALVDAGVLDMSWGPGAFCEQSRHGGCMRVSSAGWAEQSGEVHALIKARVQMPSPHDDASPLVRSLLAAGHVRLFFNGGFHPGGIEINRDFNWVAEHGEVVNTAWALGIPTEGAKFYTFVVPRPGVNSTAVVDAGRAVAKMLSMVTGQVPARQLTAVSQLPTEEYASAFASLYGAL